jgi:hypothetical protein
MRAALGGANAIQSGSTRSISPKHGSPATEIKIMKNIHKHISQLLQAVSLTATSRIDAMVFFVEGLIIDKMEVLLQEIFYP